MTLKNELLRKAASRQREILIFSKYVTQKMVSMCLAKFDGTGQQQQQGAQLMKMIYVSSAHQATKTASASSLDHDHVSSHFYYYLALQAS